MSYRLIALVIGVALPSADVFACENFTGTWKGNCEVSEKNETGTQQKHEQLQLINEQVGCEKLIQDKTWNVTIGKTFSSSEEYPKGYYTISESMDWTENQTRLNWIIQEQTRLTANKNVISVTESGYFYLKDGSLVSSVTDHKVLFDYEKQSYSTSEVNYECIMNKQADQSNGGKSFLRLHPSPIKVPKTGLHFAGN